MNRSSQYQTRHRKTLFSYLESLSGKHVTASDIHHHFQQLGISIGMSTIYRHLERMIDEGLVNQYLLDKTDAAAAEYIKAHNRRYQDYDNYVWVRDAKKNKLVVGTQCRILYQDAMGRMNIALKFNEMVRNGEIGPVILGRDHHDTGGTDAPFRETSNIKDGSNIMAEMATQCYAGNAARGMSYIALHNGGGTGIGNAINGGFGMVLDGSERVDTILRMAMPWDTMVGVSRRAWARNENALATAAEYNKLYEGQDHITLPYVADDAVVEAAVKAMKG